MFSSLGSIDPELEEVLRHSPPPAMDFSLPVEQLRQMVSAMEKKTYHACPAFDTHESVISIPMRDGYQSELRIVKPGNSSSANPVVVPIFGGAFIMGTNIQSTAWARAIASLYGATVIQPSYRLAPEHKFPTAPNDIWDSVQWIAANASALDADLSQRFVIGDGSAGGNLTIVTTYRSVKEKLSPPITGALASIPNEYALGNPGLDSKSIGGYEAFYEQDFLSEDFSPFCSTAPFSALPPTYV